MRTYTIFRATDSVQCKVRDGATGKEYMLRHVVAHSPTGFEMGYGGSGPADLALSILADYFGPVNPTTETRRGCTHYPEIWDQLVPEARKQHAYCRAYLHHQSFRWQFIAPATGLTLVLSEAEIEAWLQAAQAASNTPGRSSRSTP